MTFIANAETFQEEAAANNFNWIINAYGHLLKQYNKSEAECTRLQTQVNGLKHRTSVYDHVVNKDLTGPERVKFANASVLRHNEFSELEQHIQFLEQKFIEIEEHAFHPGDVKAICNDVEVHNLSRKLMDKYEEAYKNLAASKDNNEDT